MDCLTAHKGEGTLTAIGETCAGITGAPRSVAIRLSSAIGKIIESRHRFWSWPRPAPRSAARAGAWRGLLVAAVVAFVVACQPKSQGEALPSFDQWVTFSQQTVTSGDDGSIFVEGDDSQWRYQIESPPISVEPGQWLYVRLPVRVIAGRVATGVLNADKSTWIKPCLSG